MAIRFIHIQLIKVRVGLFVFKLPFSQEALHHQNTKTECKG